MKKMGNWEGGFLRDWEMGNGNGGLPVKDWKRGFIAIRICFCFTLYKYK